MEYKSIIDVIRPKIERRMNNNPPYSELYEKESVNQDHRYEPGYFNMEQGDGWTRSFLNGAVALLYFHYKDEKYLDYLKKALPVYEEHLYSKLDDISHDTGFTYTLGTVAYYKVSGSEAARRVSLKAADEMIKRFRIKAGIVQGFGRVDSPRAQTIIDDMMNLSVIMWAYTETGNKFYKDVFESHIQQIYRYVMRDDYSFRHSFLFDISNGAPIGELNYCGYSIGSSWARGQMWALYGGINALAATSDTELYLPKINGEINYLYSKIKDRFIPTWDFNCVGASTDMIDTSAAAIMASAMLKLGYGDNGSGLTGPVEDCIQLADDILSVLLAEYMASDDADNILEGGQCGLHNAGCVWGDYFLIEALMRKIYKNNMPDFWA